MPDDMEAEVRPVHSADGIWEMETGMRHTITVLVENKPGVLARVASAIGETGTNIDNVEYQERDLHSAVLVLSLDVRNRKHLADVIRKVRRLPVVVGVQRR